MQGRTPEGPLRRGPPRLIAQPCSRWRGAGSATGGWGALRLARRLLHGSAARAQPDRDPDRLRALRSQLPLARRGGPRGRELHRRQLQQRRDQAHDRAADGPAARRHQPAAVRRPEAGRDAGDGRHRRQRRRARRRRRGMCPARPARPRSARPAATTTRPAATTRSRRRSRRRGRGSTRSSQGIHRPQPGCPASRSSAIPNVLPIDGTNCYPMVPLSRDDVAYIDSLIRRINTMIEARGGEERRAVRRHLRRQHRPRRLQAAADPLVRGTRSDRARVPAAPERQGRGQHGALGPRLCARARRRADPPWP